MRALIIFGSQSDSPIYNKITSRMKDFVMKVCSAHRTPAFLEELLEREHYDCVIAGAGLAAHLPGVTAAQTIKPVIGVPCAGNYDGLDALLAVLQMPPGVPVLTVGIDNGETAAEFVQAIPETERIVLVNHAGSQGEKAIGKAREQLDSFSLTYSEEEDEQGDAINIVFVPLDGKKRKPEGATIFVPCKPTQSAKDSLLLLDQTRHGVWVGTNRGENAVIGAVQLMNRGQYTALLSEHRKRMQHKIFNANRKDHASYKDAGVDISAGNEAVMRIKDAVRSTYDENVLAELGAFGSMYHLRGFKDPVLVASVDGVGTKIRIAVETKRYMSIGKDLVNHCVNDILVQGATPLFFLDYLAASNLDPTITAAIVEGLAQACRENSCSLIGGETAEMPGVYKPGEHDIVSAILGAVERDNVIDGSAIREGDAIIGLPSTGLHTNGYSLARRVLLEEGGYLLSDEIDGTPLSDMLLAVHRSYLEPVQKIRQHINGMAHITGGGLIENIPRVLPEGLGARLEIGWDLPRIFTLIQEKGNVAEDEMYRVFNMGIGFVIIIPNDKKDEVLSELDDALPIGTIVKGHGVEL